MHVTRSVARGRQLRERDALATALRAGPALWGRGRALWGRRFANPSSAAFWTFFAWSASVILSTLFRRARAWSSSAWTSRRP